MAWTADQDGSSLRYTAGQPPDWKFYVTGAANQPFLLLLNAKELERRLRAALADTESRAPRRRAREMDSPVVRKWFEQQTRGVLRPSAVLVPIMRRERELTVLLTRRADHLRSHQGQVSFPGGRSEPDDASAAATALREAWEEVGLRPEAVEICGYLDDYPTLTRFIVTPVVGLVDDVPTLRHDPAEVAEVFEVPLRLLMEPGRFERHVLTRDGLQLPFVQVRYEGQKIWGATAAMLRDLISRLESVTA